MLYAVFCCTKLHITFIAYILERTFIEFMNSCHVFLLMRRLCKHLVTHVTWERFESTMGSAVNGKLIFCFKAATAKITLIRSLVCVSSPVPSQITGPGERLRTICALTTSLWQPTATFLTRLVSIFHRSQPVQLWSKWSTLFARQRQFVCKRIHWVSLSFTYTLTFSGIFFWDYPGEPIPESKRQWVAVASTGPYASLHLAPKT